MYREIIFSSFFLSSIPPASLCLLPSGSDTLSSLSSSTPIPSPIPNRFSLVVADVAPLLINGLPGSQPLVLKSFLRQSNSLALCCPCDDRPIILGSLPLRDNLRPCYVIS